MPWDRGAWEKTTSRGAGNQNRVSNGEMVNNSRNVSTSISGGISFCPSCGGLMKNKKGTLYCSVCGYKEHGSSSSPKNRVIQQKHKRNVNERQKIKKQMRDVLFYMHQGKTRSQAAALSGISLSKISNWYNEGKSGYGQDNVHFYHEVSSIEKDQEIRRRTEINRQNRLKEEERKRKQREAKQRRERLQKQSEKNTIKKQMDEIVSQMRRGKTRSQAALGVGVSSSRVDEWYDMGWRRKKEPYTSFYNKVNTIEIRNKKNSGSKTVTSSKDNSVKQMGEIVSLMETGSARSDAARKLNINVATVNNWFNKGRRGDLTYIKFYHDVKRIEDSRKKSKHVPKSKTTNKSKSSTSDLIKCPKCGIQYNKKFNSECPTCKKSKSSRSTIKCPKCGEWYNKNYHSKCPHCKKDKSIENVVYCQNCGKKITGNDSIYCSECGTSLKKSEKSDDNKYKTTTPSTSKNGSSDWMTCCVILFVLFIIIGFLLAII